MVYCVWCLVYGVWCMVHGVWCMVYGAWCMVYGVWCVVYGSGFRVYGLVLRVYQVEPAPALEDFEGQRQAAEPEMKKDSQATRGEKRSQFTCCFKNATVQITILYCHGRDLSRSPSNSKTS